MPSSGSVDVHLTSVLKIQVPLCVAVSFGAIKSNKVNYFREKFRWISIVFYFWGGRGSLLHEHLVVVNLKAFFLLPQSEKCSAVKSYQNQIHPVPLEAAGKPRVVGM